MKNYSEQPEFHVSVTPAGENQYLLRTERVAPGVPLAEELIVWPIEIWLSQAASENLPPTRDSADTIARDWVYLNYRWENRWRAVDRQSNVSFSPSSSLVPLSQQIYNVLFQGSLRNSWVTATEIARIRGEALQVRLVIKDRRLASLPWELLPIGEFLGKENAYREETEVVESDRYAYLDEFDSSESDRWDIEDEDLNDSEYEEDTTFISGLLTQFSQPNSQPESARDNLANTNYQPPRANINENIPLPIASDRNSTPANETEHQTINLNSLNRSLRNFIAIFDRQNLPLPNKQLLRWSLAFVFFTAASLLATKNGWLGWRTVNYLPEAEISSPTSTTKTLPKTPSIELDKLSNPKLTEIAVKNFRQGNLETGQQMVEALLNRNALPQAKTALAAVSPNQKNNSAIEFLYGRLAWQSARSGDKTYTVEDARRYWENALKGQLKPPLYYNALGFAYYAQGDITKANQAWFDGLYHAQEEQLAKTESERRQNLENFTSNTNKLISSNDVLTAYAGLSLVLWKSAQNQPADKRSLLMAKAIELSQKVMQDDPVNFQPEALQTNWLWTKQQIQDWRNLQQIKQIGNR